MNARSIVTMISAGALLVCLALSLPTALQAQENGSGEQVAETSAEAASAGTLPSGGGGWAGSKVLWASLTMLFATFATSWAQSRIGIAGAGAMAEKPELAGTYIILIAIPETMVILGFVVAMIIVMM